MWLDQITEFDGKPLTSIGKGDVDLADEGDENQQAERDQQRQDFADVLAWLTTTLADEVKEVRLSARLTASPACIVGDEQDMTPALERMYRAMGQEMPPVKRILELNPNHPLVSGLRQAHAAGNTDTELAKILYGMALLADGGGLTDPSAFIRQIADRLATTL
jgi:molecular chaperone HtpG